MSLQPAVGLAVRQARPLCALRGLKEHVSPGLGRDGSSRRHVLNRPRSQEEAALCAQHVPERRPAARPLVHPGARPEGSAVASPSPAQNSFPNSDSKPQTYSSYNYDRQGSILVQLEGREHF